MPPPPRRLKNSSRATEARRQAALAARREQRRRARGRGRLLALTGLVALAVGLAVVIARIGSSSPAAASRSTAATAGHPAAGRPPKRVRPRAVAPFAVGLTTLRIVDPTRSMTLPGGRTAARTLLTYVRYPALGPAGESDHLGATPARSGGPFPLIVFGHGFGVTPGLYVRLLRAWVRAGYVVATPLFPLANANAPGGPNEADLPNQPADLSVVITRVLAVGAAPGGPLSGLIARRRIAVAGHSDGGDSALAVAYDPNYRDPRVSAAIILSGAEIPGLAGFSIPPGGPALLAVQGTADTINPPSATNAFYDGAPAPKYRLELLGAAHVPPYAVQEPQLSIVQRATVAFLDDYLKHAHGAAQRLERAATVPGTATLESDP